MRNGAVVWAAGVLASGWCVLALAQSPAVHEADDKPESRRANAPEEANPLMDEFVIKVRKREENLQDVPLSISAFNDQFITDAGLTSITDLAAFAPNLSFRRSSGRAFDRPAIRGQGPIVGAQTVGLFIDGVYVAGTISSTPLDNLERVEVIKGPQAAAFGRGTLAGAINFVTKTPGNDWDSKVSATVAEHDEYELRAFVSGPIIEDKLAFNLGARHYEFGGDYTNIGPGGGTIADEQTDGINGVLRFTPTDTLSATLRLDYFEDDDGQTAGHVAIDGPDLNCYLATPRGYYCGEIPGSETVSLDLNNRNDYGQRRDTFRSSLEINWDVFGGHTITSLSGWAEENQTGVTDGDSKANRNPARAGQWTEAHVDVEYKSTELRIASPDDSSIRWLAGVYLYDQATSDAFTFATGAPSATSGEVRNQAVFGSVEFDLGEQWTLSVEARYAEDEITSVSGSGLVLNDTFDSFTPRVALSWQPTDTGNVYFTAGKGTKPGAFNANVLGANVPPAEQERLAGFIAVDEEEAWTYELGAKYSLAQNRLDLTAAVFFIDWSGQQLTTAEPFTNTSGTVGSLSLLRNIGQTDITGFELGLLAQVTDRINVNLTYGYAHAEIQSACDVEYGGFVGADPVRCDQVAFPGGADTAGNLTPNAPEHTAAISVGYTRPFANGFDFFARGDVTYESTRYDQIYNLAETGSSTVVNLRTGVSRENWRLSLWARNLTDDDTPNSVSRFLDFDAIPLRRNFTAHYPRRQQFGVTFEYLFGD